MIQMSVASGSGSDRPSTPWSQPTSPSSRISATNPAVLGTNARKLVTGVAAPSYTSAV